MHTLLRLMTCGLAVLAITGCRPSEFSTPTGDAVSRVVLRDSARYEGQVESGSLALLYKNEQFIDSVDLDFGVWTVGRDSLLFLPVRAYAVAGDGGGVEIDRHVVLAGGARRPLDTWLPYFSSMFSSPAVYDRQLVYWGLRRLEPAGHYELYAIRYTFGSGRLDSLSLGPVELYTDARFHLPPPMLQGRDVVFRGDSATFVVDSAFRAVRPQPRT